VKWAAKTVQGARKEKYRVAEYREQSRMRQVREDFLKFIPFSFFLIVPGMELLLPAWLMVFPNSKPSQWSSEAE
jgi:LETM1 and EF-hand domain-containing protein 1